MTNIIFHDCLSNYLFCGRIRFFKFHIPFNEFVDKWIFMWQNMTFCNHLRNSFFTQTDEECGMKLRRMKIRRTFASNQFRLNFFLASNGTVHISFEKSCNGYFITRTIHTVYFWQSIKGSLISSWLKFSVLESVQFERNCWQSFGLRIAKNHEIPVKWRRRKTQQSIYHSLKRSNLNSKDADVT